MHKLKEQIINFDWSLKSIVKAAVAIVVIVVALSIVFSVMNSVARSVFGYGGGGYDRYDSEESFVGGVVDSLGFGGGNSVAMFASQGKMATREMAMDMVEPGMPLPPYGDEGGEDAEDYEKRNYNASYQTRKFEETCTAISDLKPLEYVVFNNSNKGERWCNYNFRVDVEHEDEIVQKLKALDPRDFSIDTSTIERSIEYSDSELVMLERRKVSTTETLTQAEKAFNDLIAQATRSGDTATLSEVINNKISTVDRLNQQLLNTQDRIDRLTKGRGEQIEQIEYAHFYVSVEKVMLLDTENFADVWKQRVQEMFSNANATLLALTVGLVSFVLAAIEFIVFAAIAVIGITIFAKLMWTVVRRIWKWQPRVKNLSNDETNYQ